MPDIRNLDFAFWSGYYGKKDNNTKEVIEWASHKAYLDLNRTLTFREKINDKTPKEKKEEIEGKRKKRRDDVTEIIESQIRNKKDDDDYDSWHEATCKRMIGVYDVLENGETILITRNKAEDAPLTLGQAQKWLNMTLKYLWLLNRSKTIKGQEIENFIENNHTEFHVPLDSYILKYVVRTKRRNSEPNNGLSDNYGKYVNDIKKFNYKWSHIKFEDYDRYKAFQQDIREDLKVLRKRIEGEYQYPILWELEHWHKAIEFYG